MIEALRRAAGLVVNPVSAETKQNLQRAWARLPEWLRVSQQMYGRHAEGCGATIGAMPRCDFACTGCYLGEEANHIPAQSVEEIKQQMRLLRPKLGLGGNLQITDGEVTLRPVEEVIELLRYANEDLGLVPMLMTHGDTFRRQPGYLTRLVAEGGLREVSIHVDVTQRGRKGSAYKNARQEVELNPLRDEFAQMIRDVRRETGRKFSAATTMTIEPGNLDGVPDVMHWLSRNADVFKMISFQPMAQVGRTVEGLGGGVDVEALWRKIAEGLYGSGVDPKQLLDGQMWLGHSSCNRYVPGYVVKQPDSEPAFHTARDASDAHEAKLNENFWKRFGGLSFRNDSTLEAIGRLAGVIWNGADLVFPNVFPYVEKLTRRLDPQHPLRLLVRWMTGRAKINGLLIVSHHFMSTWEVATPKGQERLGLCVFHVPVGDKLVSMCEVNAMGIRDAYYEDIRAGRVPGSTFAAAGPNAAVSGNPALPIVASGDPVATRAAHG